MNVLLLLFAAPGHAFLWIGLVNRLHALGIRRVVMKRLTWVFFFAAALIPLYVGWRSANGIEQSGVVTKSYLLLCWILGPLTIVRLIVVRWQCRRPELVRFHGTERLEIDCGDSMSAGNRVDRFFMRLPLNEILQPNLSRWILDAPRLAPTLDGLSIAHLSDFHFTGRVGKTYFREIARIVNGLQSDLICITGDLIDRAACFDWIADTLGRFRARHGVFYVLGNHDLRVDVRRLRQILDECGLIDLGGRRRRIEIRGAAVTLQGNERPWIANRGAIDETPSSSDGLRIVLSHSPDPFAWARRQDADLMLAGHTHGGQIRIPPLGAIFSPSLEGVKHISGVYYVAPTILHISRGISGDIPVRWNCRPEISLLQLRAVNQPTRPI